jgi:PAS domain S-box-containing protein
MNADNLHIDSKLLIMAVEQSANSVVITDKTAKIIYVNKRFLDTTGYDINEVIGENARMLKSGKQNQEFYDNLWQTIARGEQWSGQFQNVKKSGEYFWEYSTISPVVNDEGEITHFIAIKEDITKEKQSNEAIEKAREDVIKAYKAKLDFLSVMSHEIRTPLNAIIGVSNLLMFEGVNTEQKENLEILNFSADNLLRLIDEVLDYAKFEAGKLELENISFNLEDSISKIVETWRPKASEKEISINAIFEGNLNKNIIGDPGRIAQILNNLISNAIKFTEKGGVSIVLNTKELPGDLLDIELIVKDTGIGIRPEKQKELFNPFSQGGIDVARMYGGSGLGLAIVKKIVDLHNGEISIKSEVGQGTQLIVRFKAQIDTSQIILPKEAEPREDHDIEGLRVLLVEDNMMNILLARKWLKKWHAIVRIAETAEIAIDLVENSEFDMALLDLRMPDSDGFEIAKKIRNSNSTNSKIPIVALTASVDFGLREKVIESGMNELVVKPFSPKKLLQTINSVIDKSIKQISQTKFRDEKKIINDTLKSDDDRDAIKLILEKWPTSPRSRFNAEELEIIKDFLAKNNMREELSVFSEWVRLSASIKDNSGDIFLSSLKQENLDSMLKVMKQKYWDVVMRG